MFRILAFRDPNGIRPLIFGKREIDGETEWVVASESAKTCGISVESQVFPTGN